MKRFSSSSSLCKHSPISVVIPLLPFEADVLGLLQDLKNLPDQSEVILVFGIKGETEKHLKEWSSKLCGKHYPYRIRIEHTQPHRGKQLNFGARVATNPWLWFLHSDCRLSWRQLKLYVNHMQNHPQSISFLQLRFDNNSLPLMKITEWGTLFRSNVLLLPFGDQGLGLTQELFWSLNGYSEDCDFGEDHLFIWEAHLMGVPLNPSQAQLNTSRRKYSKYGWLQVTREHLWLTFQQALPKAVKWIHSGGLRHKVLHKSKNLI